MTTPDFELLQQFARDHSEKTFATLVSRHVDLVYSSALRQVRSPQLAEDVAQSVFLDLSRNADKLAPGTILTAWLYRVTRRAAIDMVRSESRRQIREQTAVELAVMNSPDAHWKEIEPLLDEAMDTLDETDRAGILLRYFENKSLHEVGQTLGTSDDAAQKRVSRAVERLRDYFSKSGIAVGSGGFVALLSGNAVQAAPIGLSTTIFTATALGGTTLATTTTAIKAIAMTTLQKALITTIVGAAVAAGIYEIREASLLESEVQSLREQQDFLAPQFQKLAHERDDALRDLASLRDDNERLARNTAELPKLRSAVARLRQSERELVQLKAGEEADPMLVEMKSWLARVNQLKKYLEQNPKENVPEYQFLTKREWLTTADAGIETPLFEKTSDVRQAMDGLRFQAEQRFAIGVESALRKYSEDNNQQFPTDLSQLQSYCDPAIGKVLLDLYRIAPASLAQDTPTTSGGPSIRISADVKGDWIIVRKQRILPKSTSRLAIFLGGSTYWQSPPGSDAQ